MIIHDTDDIGLARPSAEAANDEVPSLGSLEGPAIGHDSMKFPQLRCYSFLILSAASYVHAVPCTY